MRQIMCNGIYDYAESRNEILRYLGHKGQDIPQSIDEMMQVCWDILSKSAAPSHVYNIFNISFKPDGIYIENTKQILTGVSIRTHLDNCTQIIIFAATLGVQADVLMRQTAVSDITKALILDSCATQLIERYCDEIERTLTNGYNTAAFNKTARFSPGYGDFPISLQPDFINLLNADKKIGLTCTENYMLLPRKSVTAVIGLSKGGKKAAGSSSCGINIGCNSCKNFESCMYSRKKHIAGNLR